MITDKEIVRCVKQEFRNSNFHKGANCKSSVLSERFKITSINDFFENVKEIAIERHTDTIVFRIPTKMYEGKLYKVSKKFNMYSLNSVRVPEGEFPIIGRDSDSLTIQLWT